MKSIKVDINQNNISYDILFWNNILEIIKSKINNIWNKKILFVIDDNVFKLYINEIFDLQKKLNAFYLTIKHWEENKNYNTTFEIIDFLVEKQFTRNDYVIALWWWVTWDITWFAASLFKRGMNLIQIPTTLLSMLDSSVWWKTWVDYKWIKNLIWTFKSPNFVIINSDFLQTLDENEVLSWYFEWIKHSILSSREDFIDFSNNYNLLININLNTDKIIEKNIRFKLKVVESDPLETNWNRRILNYGHTFWHALETFSNFKLSHGICVWFWILFANLLSLKRGILKQETFDEINILIKEKLKNIKLDKLDFEKIFEFMANDKKNDSDYVKFILLEDYWKTIEYDASKVDIKEIFDLFV